MTHALVPRLAPLLVLLLAGASAGGSACNGDAAMVEDASSTDAAPADAAPADAATADGLPGPDAATSCAGRADSSGIAGTLEDAPIAFEFGHGLHIGGDCDAIQLLLTNLEVVDLSQHGNPSVTLGLFPVPDGGSPLGVREVGGQLDLDGASIAVSGTMDITALEGAVGHPTRLAGTLTVTGAGVSLAGPFDVSFCDPLEQFCI